MLKKKNLIFVGAPGAGKGTFSALLQEDHPMAHISTGDLLRDEVKRDTKLGREAAALMKEGKLVPDEVIAGMVRDRLAQPDCESGFILDGFPRTIRQAELLDEALASLGRKLDRVVYFKVDDDTILKRLTARQNCRKCGKIYNKIFMPPTVADVCDACGDTLYQRADDSLETAKARLDVFYRQTSPLIDHYRKRGLLFEITGLDRDKVHAELTAELA
ncbi:adenylate kinase [bioreactor metagenome]|uniref:Adenylate kinase n=1 Tax=bioreactor metagenome TaxID=1076179 RepID=A0A645CFL1_9ZZZZ